MELYRVVIRTKIAPIEVSYSEREEIEGSIKNIKNLLEVQVLIYNMKCQLIALKDFNSKEIIWKT